MHSFDGQTLFDALRFAAKKFGSSSPILEDAVGGSMSYKRVLIGSRFLGKRFASLAQKGDAVAVLLPNANAVVATFFGLQSAALIPAMLNYTAGPAVVSSACKTVEAKLVISSRTFIKKAELEHLVTALEKDGLKFLWLEDVQKSASIFEKALAWLFKGKQLQIAAPSDPALILFTSGSEGLPKGVVLSHANILSNCGQIDRRIEFGSADKLFNVLPVFHSFGMTGGMVLPLVTGVKLYLYPSPLHFKIIPQAIKKSKPTILFGTDTFLNGYSRTAKDEDFASLRLVVAGAEAVKESTRNTWKDRFDTLVLEGFGMTEAAPVVAVNTPDENKPGSVGQLLPDMEHRLEPVDGIKEGGRLWLKGPNIMLGYMKADMPGKLQHLENGWHDSGDIVEIDENGFVTIKGRAKRFAKIAGEMVSLGGVESVANAVYQDHENAAVSIPDKKRGEKIILVTNCLTANRSDLVKQVKKQGFSELLVPSAIVNIDSIPLLGTGKTDYVALQKAVLDEI